MNTKTINIPSDVLDACLRGCTTYTLPAGDVVLDAPIVIPAGMTNFTLRGSSEGTTLKPAKHLDRQAIQVGALPQLHNNWMITGPNNIAVKPCKTGDVALVRTDGNTLSPGYYVLWDEYKIVCAKGPNISMNHAEIVEVVGGKLTKPIGREYAGNVWLAPYAADRAAQKGICRNITIRDLAWDGKAPDGSVSEGLVAVGVVDGAILANLTASNFRSDAVMTNTSRNVSMNNIQVSGASEGDAGGGYGISVYRSRFVRITNSRATECRHGVLLHSGSLDCQIQLCWTPIGFDLHGYDERRIAFTDCSGAGGDAGNDAWLGGASDVLYNRCNFTEPIGLHANVRNVRIVDSTIGGLALYSVEAGTTPTVGVPAEGFPTGIRLDRTVVKGILTTQGARRVGTFAMNGGSLEGYSTLIDIANEPVTGMLLLSKVAIKNGPETAVQLRNQGPGFHFGMDGCTIDTEASTCVWASDTFKGQATLRNCTYPPGKAFLSDQSGGHVVAAGNLPGVK